jgi:hypothetical protein
VEPHLADYWENKTSKGEASKAMTPEVIKLFINIKGMLGGMR